ncbi:DUF4388 domain-containing protein [Geothrix sp. PMB-07]|uniref:DUF4388 domain-containing protein n=1 Tax=Geothrix sp. PMB-07 TaxID=3068640 RepID=UPI00274081B8|nr:DUF4388 domain-containing protein [Geothrix sp. PMB-07]WLT30349.1 DUF4388 domain-containing protein [Geothrix sp. PMB-07]
MSQGVIQGSMREAPLPDIIQLVSQGGKSGCFHVQQEASRARIYLKDGRIIHAVTHAGEGFEALMEVALWLDGTYRFEEEAAEVTATITKPNASILMELGRRMDEWRVISQKVPSVELYPASTLLPGETAQGVNPREAKLLGLATGYYTVAELAEVLQKPVLNVAKDLYGLVMAGHLVMKGIRSGKAPKVEAPVEAPARELVPASAMFAASGPVTPQFPEEETAIVRIQAPPPLPRMGGFPENEEPLPETVGGGVAGGVPLTPPPPSQAQGTAPKPAPMDDPQRMVKLMNFTQRIAQAAKMVLPEAQHEMVNRLQAKATQQIISGDGPEAVKGLALAISRGAVDAGCDADMVRTLNTHLKALFSTK